MINYVLLRNNEKEGPFSLEELLSRNLKSFDLICKEGHSSHWLYANEIEELEPYLKDEQLPSKQNLEKYQRIDFTTPAICIQQSELTSRKKYEDSTTDKITRLHKSAINILGFIAAVFSGLLIIGAVSVKNLYNSNGITHHLPLLSVNKLPYPALPEGSVPDQPINKHIQNALVTELIAVDKTNDQHRQQVLHNLKKQITITGSDYTSGKTDGIKNLYLTIENKSYILLKNVKVQVDYLNSFGELLHSQVLTIKNVPARSERSWKMMDTKNGVKVQYKVLDVFSKKKKSVFFEA